MKVLISAYSCRPGHGSEPGAGWAWTHAATRRHEVWLITHSANARALEMLRASDPVLADRLHPTYIHLGRFEGLMRRAGPLRLTYYIAWQLGACRRASRRLQAEVGFDVCHHLTYAADWMPAGVGSVPGVPFVWGPVGGSSTISSPRVWARLGLRTFLVEAVRAALLRSFALTIGRSLARRAALVIGQNTDVVDQFKPVQVQVEPHVALESPYPAPGRRRPSGGPPVAMYAGRLVGWKGLVLAVSALRRPALSEWRFEIYGDGPERRRLERLARRWGVAERVCFRGLRPRAEVLDALSSADVFLFPSLHDAAGWAVAEAIAAGCPVVALDAGGPRTLLGPGDGVLVDPKRDVVNRIAKALPRARHLAPHQDRWQAARLPDLVTDAYTRAVTGRDARDLERRRAPRSRFARRSSAGTLPRTRC